MKYAITVFVFILLAPIVSAQSTIVGTISLIPNFETIGVTVSYTDDSNQNNNAVIFLHFLSQGQVKRLNHRHLSHYPSPYSTRRVPV